MCRCLPFIFLYLFCQSPSLRAEPPARIVSLDLCTDWMLLKYADLSQVKAFSPLLYRYQADWVPDDLPVHDGSLETILELDPDLLIAGEYNAILLRKRLQQLGRNVEVLPLPTGLDSIRAYQQRFLTIIEADQDDDQLQWSEKHPQRNQTLLLLGANGIGTGRDTLENDLIERAGWNNYIQAKGYVDLRLEEIVAMPPDAIYWSAPLSNSLANLFAKHTAITKTVEQFKIPPVENWRWECPGPWSLELIEELAQWESF
jgi:iron complex transport system substrate-binding protein